MNYAQPKELCQLKEILATWEGPCRFVAGCTDFLAQRNGRPWREENLISLTELQALRQLRAQEEALYIGALCTHGQIAAEDLIRSRLPALAAACEGVGSQQIRNRGTIGGSVANASPAGDMYPVLLLLDAQAMVLDAAGEERFLGIEQLILDKGGTALQNKQVLLGFRIPLPGPYGKSAFGKLGERRVVTIAKLSLAVSAHVQEGIMSGARVVLGAAAPKAFLVEEGAQALNGQPYARRFSCGLGDILSQIIQQRISGRASMPYKKEAVKGLAQDVLEKL